MKLALLLEVNFQDKVAAHEAIFDNLLPNRKTTAGERFLLIDEDDDYTVVEVFVVPGGYVAPEDLEDVEDEDADPPIVPRDLAHDTTPEADEVEEEHNPESVFSGPRADRDPGPAGGEPPPSAEPENEDPSSVP